VKLSSAEVLALAPDSSAVSAARKLTKAAPWQSLGQSARAFWGECQGSTLYQTQVSALDLAFKCTCPSRKLPCKHALALLFLMAEAPQGFIESAEPRWVDDWLSKRNAAQQKKQARAEAPVKPVDLEAQAKRQSKRHENVLAGLEQLEVWLTDLVRRGIGHLPSEAPSFWDAAARRLVDAQAPGAAGRIRAIAARVGSGDDWAERVLGEIGRLALLVRAYRRIDALPVPLAHDVRRLIGYTLEQSEVVAHGDVVDDEWVVASSVVEEDERYSAQRSWLVGTNTRRKALVLQFSAAAAPFPELLLAGTALKARLAFWPSAAPQRALLLERLGPNEPRRAPAHALSVAAALEGYATELSQNPWTTRSLFLLDGVAIAHGPVCHVVDSAGAALPLSAVDHDVLWATSGGHPLLLAGEWNGFELRPLTAFAEGRTVVLRLGGLA
jgi:hypothetical protein